MLVAQRLISRISQIPGARRLWRSLPVGPLELRARCGISSYPPYLYGVYSAAKLAKQLGVPAISVIEFGVAGGRGLRALEDISSEVAKDLGIRIAVYGFDSGEGLPAPRDYRDLPNVWDSGFYKMDQAALQASLKCATLILGDIAQTLPQFLDSAGSPPVGFVAFDLDYYSSTRIALRVFDGPPNLHLPRVYCYFDDIIWPEYACHNEYIGELAAIREFNEESPYRKIAPIHLLRCMLPNRDPWHEQMYAFHHFTHPQYCTNISPRNAEYSQLPLFESRTPNRRAFANVKSKLSS